MPGLHCREMVQDDIPAVATLLRRGFPRHSRRFWLRALEQLIVRESPPGLPRYGYLMEHDGVPVGVILFICSAMRVNDMVSTRCNLSSWYVEPNFRAYAPMFRSCALGRSGITYLSDITYLNVSPRPHTQPIIEAQGFSRYCDGIFVAVPILSGLFGGEQVKVCTAQQAAKVASDPFEQKMLLEHAAHGCVSLWCVTPENAYPFVFHWRFIKAVIPCAQLIYCRDIADFIRFARPIGWFLARRGRPFVIIDANGPIPGLVGRFFRDWMPPKYYKGPVRPRLGDLAYTEYAILGV